MLPSSESAEIGGVCAVISTYGVCTVVSMHGVCAAVNHYSSIKGD